MLTSNGRSAQHPSENAVWKHRKSSIESVPSCVQSAPGFALAEDVVHAVALNVKMPNTISFEAFVPTTLYDRDPVKAVVVEAYLRTLAARHGDVYERTPMMIEGHTSPVVVHRIHGFGSCHELESRTQNPTLTFLADVRAAITSDISQYSTAYNVPIVPQREEKGSILESLGIQSAPLNGERSVDVDLNAPFLR